MGDGIADQAWRAWPHLPALNADSCGAKRGSPSGKLNSLRTITLRRWKDIGLLLIEWHPTQMLADFLTMPEASGKPL
jgi:hypothetical protein